MRSHEDLSWSSSRDLGNSEMSHQKQQKNDRNLHVANTIRSKTGVLNLFGPTEPFGPKKNSRNPSKKLN